VIYINGDIEPNLGTVLLFYPGCFRRLPTRLGSVRPGN
jgi:hypothetical protein